ncbi:4-carboxymuconolactone decarboxylase-like protein [Mytilinidion resinicola]|uniref:4-carboxymuconolactone decarboxylase-like protein n=1 Tax=Mytilinidion resinicola TaxID=574789 RepID=A0A6A6YJW5_9PEZI|nr:4-carboxymuconolactone decarboxylase-like protein [Mytilinidion resinicola]KAF2809080.1 4-carboxymuconolactone decarboxylase-like protein [Mytilinidion resinicola]
MRLPYVPNPPHFTDPTDQAILERVQKRRGERGLLELDRALLHSPPVADGWNSFLGAIRTRTTIPASIRETAICRVAVLNKAWYEWEHHAPLLRECPGITEEIMQYIKNAPPAPRGGGGEAGVGYAGPLDEKHATVLAYTDQMTIGVAVEDGVFGELKRLFEEREVVEITATVAAYNCVSRFLVALDVGEKNA